MDLLNKLQTAGLTKREAHIYLALLQKKEFAASEISSMVPVGRTKVYEAMPSLISKGFCKEIYKDGKKIYCAVEPKVAIKSLMSFYRQKIKEEIALKEEEMFKKGEMFEELEKKLVQIYFENNEKFEQLDYIEILKDKNQIGKRWIELQQSIQFEILGFNKPPYSLDYSENIKPQEAMMKRKKIISRGIYEQQDILLGAVPTDFYPVIDFYSKLGEECRVVDKLPMKMMIIDEKIVMLALNDLVSTKPSITTLLIKHPDFAKALKEVFEIQWSKSIPFEEIRKA